MFSFLASAVTISTGRLGSAASALIALQQVKPFMFGMFMSQTTKSNFAVRSLAAPSTPSSASSTLS